MIPVLRMVITNTFIPRDRKNTVVNLMITIFSPARTAYFTKFQNFIFDLKVMKILILLLITKIKIQIKK